MQASGQARAAGPLSQEDVERIQAAARDAERAVVAASNGLDMSEGLDIFRPNAHFMQAYGDFARAYGVQSVLHGLSAHWPNEGERWGFVARFAKTEWLDYEPSPVMRRVRALVGGTDAWAVTCNMDGRLVKAGFPEGRVLETEGSIRQLVCPRGCSDELYPSERAFERMAEAMAGGPGSSGASFSVPDSLIPRCPRCGAPLAPNIRDDRFLRPDAEYAGRRQEFERWLEAAHGKRILVLELGIGARNQAIKRPLMELVAREPQATYVTFNYSEVSIPEAIAEKSVGVPGDLGAALERIVPEA